FRPLVAGQRWIAAGLFEPAVREKAGMHWTPGDEVRLDRAGELLAKPTAWLFGPESHGLPSEVAAAADHRVRIPMAGGAESLNVASAAAICLYQSARALELFMRP
ncbi:TrmH family RNA methyltransferase, partial [Mycobacterium avium]|uniref:TrmH family RNA methyltransferase n=1 Tax=Mycobacterium avium TaxID=1764 RepID=UPI0026DA6F57